MDEENGKTYFYNTNKEMLGSCAHILPIPLRIGMKMSIHSFDNEYEVVDWNFHWGHEDEKSGLRIFLKETTTKAPYMNFRV
jgi:hypothetical protein